MPRKHALTFYSEARAREQTNVTHPLNLTSEKVLELYEFNEWINFINFKKGGISLWGSRGIIS